MKMRYALLAAALSLLLAGCQAEEPVETVSVPLGTATPMKESAPSEAPSPTQDPLEELLARQPIDDDHDAFLVDTGGRLGTLLVTAELEERGPEPKPGWESWEYPVCFAVWNPKDMSQPIQKLEGTTWGTYHWHEALDANFDGYMDFSYMYAMGNQPNYWYLWVWDEDAGQFVEVPEYREISGPRCNPETEIIDGWARYSGGGDGLTTFYRWEDGALVCIRRIETGYDDENRIYVDEVSYFPSWIKVEDRIDGELTQVYYQYFAPDAGTDFFPERFKWENLDYHGEN